MNFGFNSPGFHIPQAQISPIPESGLPYTGAKIQWFLTVGGPVRTHCALSGISPLGNSSYRCGKFNHRYPNLTRVNSRNMLKIYGLCGDFGVGYLEVKK